MNSQSESCNTQDCNPEPELRGECYIYTVLCTSAYFLVLHITDNLYTNGTYL